jgi:hypothetical protein
MFIAATMSAGATMSSTALAPSSTRFGTGAHASGMPAKWSHAVVVWAGTGRVSNVASQIRASVPSDPTIRRRKISTGSSASRNAHRR